MMAIKHTIYSLLAFFLLSIPSYGSEKLNNDLIDTIKLSQKNYTPIYSNLNLSDEILVPTTIKTTSKGNGTIDLNGLVLRIFDQHDDGIIYKGGHLDLETRDIDSDGINELVFSGELVHTGETESDPIYSEPITSIFSLNCKTGYFYKMKSISEYSIIISDSQKKPIKCPRSNLTITNTHDRTLKFRNINSDFIVTDQNNYQCKNIDKSVIEHVLKKGLITSDSDIHDYYSYTGCSVSGELKIDGTIKNFHFYYGGILSLGNNQTIACGQDCCKNNFKYCTYDNPSLPINLDNTDSNLNISVSKGKYKDYYHIQLSLKDIPFKISSDNNGKDYSKHSKKDLIDNGGQFEILIPSNKFPISAPNCKSNIKVRMPWTNSSLPNSIDLIKDKIKVLDSLLTADSPPVITLELNPYINVFSKQPLKLELKNCNVFFRHAKGKYIDYLGTLRN